VSSSINGHRLRIQRTASAGCRGSSDLNCVMSFSGGRRCRLKRHELHSLELTCLSVMEVLRRRFIVLVVFF
jgi:hypothetical protein